jgi:hypothetical protein
MIRGVCFIEKAIQIRRLKPQSQAAPRIPLTQALINTWTNFDLIQSANLPGGGVQPGELSVLSKQDLILQHLRLFLKGRALSQKLDSQTS